MLFFKRTLNMHRAYNILNDKDIGNVNVTAISELSRYTEINPNAFYALNLYLFCYTAYVAHGSKGLAIADEIVYRRINTAGMPKEVEEHFETFRLRGSQYPSDLINRGWSTAIDNEIYFKEVEVLLGGIFKERFTESLEFVENIDNKSVLMESKRSSLVIADAAIKAGYDMTLEKFKKYKV